MVWEKLQNAHERGCASGRFGRPLGGPGGPRGPGGPLKGLGAPAGSQGRASKNLYLYTSMGGPRKGAMVAAVAQLYLGSMTFFAAREARAASGSAWRLSSPQLRL